MILKNLFFRLKYKRNREVPAGISDEIRSFVELNYVPETITEEATADLFDVREINQALEEYSVYSAQEEPSVGATIFSEDEEREETEAFSIYGGRATDLPDTSYSMPDAAPKGKRGISFSVRKRESAEERAYAPTAGSLEDVIAGLGQTFQQKLLGMIDTKGFTDSEVYKRANIDRKHFSKIRCNINYKPSKSTALALAVALRLNLDEATDILSRAGLAFSPSSKQDLIVKYCIMNEIYDIYDVNALLYEYDQPLLGN